MNTLICPTCGCSLVRLGVTKDKATSYRHNRQEYHFCCQGCVDLFITDPEEHLQETNNLIVCPTCLAEKPLNTAVKVKIGNQELHFCRCPYCPEAESGCVVGSFLAVMFLLNSLVLSLIPELMRTGPSLWATLFPAVTAALISVFVSMPLIAGSMLGKQFRGFRIQFLRS